MFTVCKSITDLSTSTISNCKTITGAYASNNSTYTCNNYTYTKVACIKSIERNEEKWNEQVPESNTEGNLHMIITDYFIQIPAKPFYYVETYSTSVICPLYGQFYEVVFRD